MVIGDIISAILSPSFLANRINTIALVLAAVTLVMLSDFFNGNIIFPIADVVRTKTHSRMRKTKAHKKAPWFTKHFAEGIAALIFILYCYLGTTIVAEYLYAPILGKLKSVITLAVIALFFGISYLINNRAMRRSLMKV